ncbi:MAG: hypothetical protein AABW72_05930 [archaeon]
MTQTSIQIQTGLKKELDCFKEHPRETYNDTIQKLIYIVKNVESNPKLSKQTLKEIEKARKRINSGQYFGSEQIKAKLGI